METTVAPTQFDRDVHVAAERSMFMSYMTRQGVGATMLEVDKRSMFSAAVDAFGIKLPSRFEDTNNPFAYIISLEEGTRAIDEIVRICRAKGISQKKDDPIYQLIYPK